LKTFATKIGPTIWAEDDTNSSPSGSVYLT
jgi:hypothetical protein